MTQISRRTFVAGAAAALGGSLVLPSIARAANAPKIVIVGGGFGGTSLARFLRRHSPDLAITLIEKDTSYVTCPFSNGVIGGLWDISAVTHSYDGVKAAGIDVVHDVATKIDPDKKTVALKGGDVLPYDYLVVSPGIQLIYSSIEGYSEEAAQKMPHAWQAGPQTVLLRQQLEAMDDGGVVVIGVPAPPFRCPPGPYERASLIANYIKTSKPKSKLIILDASESFAKQDLFQEAWDNLFPGIVQWIPGSQSGIVMSVDAATMKVSTSFDDYTPAVANIIPAQKAGQIAIDTGLDAGQGFCSIDPATFESTVHKGIYVLGDSTIAGAMPKSGFSANNQAKNCGEAILADIAGKQISPAKLLNICYSFANADYAFEIVDAFAVEGDTINLVFDDNRETPLKASLDVHKQESIYAHSWYDTITKEMFG